MKKIITLLLLGSMIMVSGCKKTDNLQEFILRKVSPALFNFFGIYQDNQGLITIHVHRTGCGDAGRYYMGTGEIFTSDTLPRDTPVDGGLIRMGTLTFPSRPANSFLYDKVIPAADTPAAHAIFGSNATFGLAGNSINGIQGFSTTMYVPEEIALHLNSCCYNGISKSQDLTVNWNADLNNPNDVFIIFRYDGATSHERDPSLPAADQELQYAVSDNGSYTIDHADFAGFPVGGDVIIYIGRGNYDFPSTLGGQTYEIIGYTTADHRDYLIQ